MRLLLQHDHAGSFLLCMSCADSDRPMRHVCWVDDTLCRDCGGTSAAGSTTVWQLMVDASAAMKAAGRG